MKPSTTEHRFGSTGRWSFRPNQMEELCGHVGFLDIAVGHSSEDLGEIFVQPSNPVTVELGACRR
jgi:hypothetical protein